MANNHGNHFNGKHFHRNHFQCNHHHRDYGDRNDHHERHNHDDNCDLLIYDDCHFIIHIDWNKNCEHNYKDNDQYPYKHCHKHRNSHHRDPNGDDNRHNNYKINDCNLDHKDRAYKY